MEAKKRWFEEWFDSPYYHLLYNSRDEKEAASFIDKLLHYLHPPAGAVMLDVACGKGRHAKQLADDGYDVTGIDLSPASILAARQMETETLHFFQHDMRLPFWINYYDFAFNFFTSFGYFDTELNNENALHNMMLALKPGGKLVLDYLNSSYTREHLVPCEQRQIGSVHFDIERVYQDRRFLKQIRITDAAKNVQQTFTESVRAYTLEDFKGMFARHRLQMEEVFGDYLFNRYDERMSPRLILIAKKS